MMDIIFDNLYDEYLLDSDGSDNGGEKYTVNSCNESIDEEVEENDNGE